ncbi:MAG: acylphosphatase [Phycisphaerae bacterium]
MTVREESNRVRRRVIYRGRVQGVFFRATTYDLSRRFRVAGYVRNMPDGTVELEAEGEPSEVEPFLAAIADEFSNNIRKVETADLPPRGDEEDFRIRY